MSTHTNFRNPSRLTAVVLAVLVLLAAMPSRAAQSGAIETALNATLIVLDRDGAALGSAVLLADGHVITTADVVGNHGWVHLRLGAGRDPSIRARVIARDGQRGVAVIRPDGDLPFGTGLGFAPSSGVPGQEVFAIGAPLGLDAMVTRGTLTGAPAQPDPTVPVHGLRHDAVVNVGVAGGALVDEAGRLLGLIRAGREGDLAGFGWALSGTDIARLMPLMISGDLRDVPSLGLTLRPLTPVIAAALGLPVDGMLVDGVAPGSRAAVAGLKAGDVVLSADGVSLDRPGDLAWYIDRRRADAIRLSVRRHGAGLVVTLNLARVAPSLARIGGGIATVAPVARYSFARLGVRFDDEMRVTTVHYHSPLYAEGLQRGDVVLALNGAPTTRQALDALEIAAPVLLLVSRGGRTLHVLVDPWRGVSKQTAEDRRGALDARVHLF